MRVQVIDLNEGDVLSRDTFNNFGLHVLSKGTTLQRYDIARLIQHQIDYVDINDKPTTQTPASRTIESTTSPKWLPTVEPIYKTAVSKFETLFSKALNDGEVDDDEVTATLQPLLSNLQLERDVVSMLLLLNTSDDYTYQHSVQVGMLSYYLATWVGYDNKESLQIGKAGFLHDIGKCRIDLDILNKPAKLTKDEFDEVKKHTLYGHEIITKSFDEPYLAVSALQHHERVDGSGYPHGLKGEEIHPVAKIISVVDIYSAMISERVYQQRRDLFDVLKELYNMSFAELDAFTTHIFIKHMIPNFIGKKVELVTGEIGVIVMTHPTEFFQPLIRIDENFIDLTVERGYEIKQVYL
ncbi:HD-GYP domain-containing protein [Paenibacillus sp. YIM B09110]|uniref:HD-GYP domain-containing protein n=1 Tax=Paenibacillus sp. YIM B09110 TaxID=3126102 RepID=UPI00301D94E0